MREIKFQAWDKELERMCKVIRIDLRMGTIIVFHPDEEELSPELPISRFNLREYTGLKDKNGKEIYEGNIIKSNRGHIAAVEWDDENGRFLAFTATRRIMYVGQEPTVEIIGNIYENPELLTA